MKNFYIAVIAASILISAPVLAQKRGVSENSFQYKAQLEALKPGVSWYYNWGNSAGSNVADVEDFEYVPMCWSGSYNADNIRRHCQNHPETKYLLGFNEPNFKAQANMTPQQAADAWPAVQALAKELGLKIVAPALNYSPDAPYTDPTKWMDEFVALVGNDAFDYTAIHSYGGFDVMKGLATRFHDRYGKPVWVTEFCYWPNEGDNNSVVSPDQQIQSMIQSLEWLEKTEWIFRYAWFKAIGNSNSSKGPNYGLLLSGKAEEPRELSEQGKVYCNMPTFDPEVYHPTNTVVPASQFQSQFAVLMGSTADADCGSEIEITRFNAGAWLDYQFDVPAEDDYYLRLRVSGVGEPTRFDPSIGVYAVKEDGTEGEELAKPRRFTLSGDDSIYDSQYFKMHLKAGKQTLRLRDTNPYTPSGIHISSLQLTDVAGVECIESVVEGKTVNVYNMQGVCVKRNVSKSDAAANLPTGLYIIGTEKIYVR